MISNSCLLFAVSYSSALANKTIIPYILNELSLTNVLVTYLTRKLKQVHCIYILFDLTYYLINNIFFTELFNQETLRFYNSSSKSQVMIITKKCIKISIIFFNKQYLAKYNNMWFICVCCTLNYSKKIF